MPRPIKAIACAALSIAIMIFIFSMSGQGSGESNSMSDSVSRLLASTFMPGFNTLDTATQLQIIHQLAWPIRKTAHATEYGCLAISLFMTCWQGHEWYLEASRKQQELFKRVIFSCVLAFVLAVLYACTDETHQLFIDGRSGQVTDVLVDASGALIGIIFAGCCCFLFMRRKSCK